MFLRMVLPTVLLFSLRTSLYVQKFIIVVDLQIGSVRDVDLLAFDIPAPREHLRVCPLTVATATQYAVDLFELVSLYRRPTQLRA